jgi:hypothetical protein
MANGRRSIYSRRQSMPAGTYDTPLADFLDALPQYINQYQQNQLRMKQYEDTVKQREYNNELNLYRLLPDEDLGKAMATSKNSSIKSLGENIMSEENAFQGMLNFDEDVDLTDMKKIEKLTSLANSPNVAKYPHRLNQVNSQINKIKNNSVVKKINDYYTKNPDDPRKETDLLAASAGQGELVLKELVTRKSRSDRDLSPREQIDVAIEVLTNIENEIIGLGSPENYTTEQKRQKQILDRKAKIVINSMQELGGYDFSKTGLNIDLSDVNTEEEGYLEKTLGKFRGLFASEEPKDLPITTSEDINLGAPADSTGVALPKIKLNF